MPVSAIKKEVIGRALILQLGDMTRVHFTDDPTFKGDYWIRADGLIGLDRDDDDRIDWVKPGLDGMQLVETTETPDAALDLLQESAIFGVEEAGIVDVNNPRIRS